MNFPLPAFRPGLIPLVLTAIFCLLARTADAQVVPPTTLTRTVSTSSSSVTVNLALHPIRSTNFKVLVQQADGSFNEFTPSAPRTYLGTVDGFPGALAYGLLREDSSLMCRIAFEDGTTWQTTGGTASSGGSTSWTPAWPTSVVRQGGAGGNVRAAELGIDATYREFLACGSDVAKTLEMIEYVTMCTNGIYLRDAALIHRLGRILIRADQTADPYEPDGGDTGKLLPHIRTEWNTTLASTVGNTHDIALVVRPGAGGGLAYVGTIGTASRYSANGADANGDFHVIWRHEAGHNWGSSHYEGGGKPEGPTIMSDNGLSRFSSSELRKIIDHRDTKLSILDNLGPYPFPLPPRANMDRAVFLPGSPLVIDVLDNDSDSNGEAISLLSFDTTSALGGTITRSVGTGPGGRDQVVYTSPANYESGNDSFAYYIADSTGLRARGHVVVAPISGITPLDHWKLDETSGTTAFNSVSGRSNGTHTTVTINQAGSTSVTGRSTTYNGTNGRTTVTAPNYGTNILTLTTWVKRTGTQTAMAGVVYSGSNTSGTGLCIGPANDIQFRWNGSGYKTAPSPALTLPDGQWCLVAMSVTPNNVTIHLRTPTDLQSVTTPGTFSTSAFTSTLYFGRDSSTSRYFRGSLDDIRVYGATLSAGQIESLYLQATDPPELAITSPAAGSSVPALDLDLNASVSNGSIDGLTFLDGTAILGTVADESYSIRVPYLYPGTHTVKARAPYGDWDYEAESPAIAFTVQTPPLPMVTLRTEGTPSRSGPVSGQFIISRNHPIGAITVPLAISGTAVAGTDYAALPTSISLPDGTLTATIPLDPIASATPLGNKTVILSPEPGALYTLGTPASATHTIGDHITSIASSAWNVATTWTNGIAAPTSGTQGTGLDYAVAHTVASNDSASNSQTLIGKSLRIQRGGMLDLIRAHNGTLTTATYSLPPLTLQDGAAIRFTASNGSDLHSIPATIQNSGTTSLLINAGTYDNGATLGGAISGSGTIRIISQSNAGGGAYVRTVSVTSANNPFTGNWTIEHTPTSTDDSAGLRANAGNSLGTGTVTVGTRGQLINNATNGLNSLAGVILNGAGSSLVLTQPWNKSTANLALTGGSPTVALGNASSSIGNLSGTGGTIQGSGSSSSLTVNQTTDAIFSGSFGANLRFTKSGPADLQLAGTLSTALPLTLTAGSLGFGGATPTLASLTQSGGDLHFHTGTPATPRLKLTGNYSRTGGGIHLTATTPPTLATPHVLVAYSGTRSGTPAFTFENLSGTPLVATVNYGTTTNSVITVTFSEPDPFLAWIASYGLTGPKAERTADPDGDGLTNLQEMILGLNPADPNSRLTLSVASVDENTVHLILNRAVTTGSFFLQSSTSLSGTWIETPVTVAADTHGLPITTARDGERRFYRIVYRSP